MNYNFDKKIDRTQTKVRKWDQQLIKAKYDLEADVIPMDIADLDFEVAPAIKTALVKRAEQGDYGYSYTYDAYYEAVIAWNARRFQVSLEKEWIRLTFGTVGTLHYLVQAFCKAGDAVMIHTPAYHPFQEAVASGACQLICSPLKLEQGRYEMDFTLMEQQMIDHKVKLFILCSPQNPSGRVWTAEELYKLSVLCIQYDVLLVADEIHRDIIHQDTIFTSLWNAHPDIKNQSIVCVSPNKGFNLGGLKSSYVLIANPDLRRVFDAYLKKVYITSPHVFAVPALIAAYNESEAWLDELTAYIELNFEKVYAWFKLHLPQARVMKADSSFLVWIDVSEVFQDETVMTAFFNKAKVTVVPGSYFVQDGAGWVRLNLGTQHDVIDEVLHRLEMVLHDKDPFANVT